MSAFETLKTLAQGKRPGSGLLHSCRFEGFGAEGYGEEDIVARLAAAAAPISLEAVVLSAPGHLAVLDGERAYFADLAGEHIARLWVLSDDEQVAREPCVSVVFEPDLAQARGDVFVAAADHAALDAAAVATVEALGRNIVAASPYRRTRAFSVRAFGTAQSGAALFAVYRQGDGAAGSPGFAMTAVGWREGATQVIHDRAGERTASRARWTPHVAA